MNKRVGGEGAKKEKQWDVNTKRRNKRLGCEDEELKKQQCER